MPDDSALSLFGIPLRQPPSNLMAERALLGALMSNNKAIDMCEGLRSDMFADPVNGRVFTAILHRISVGRIADAVSLKDDFENSEALEEVGGTKYLSELLGSMVAIINAREYAQAIRNLYMRRQLIDIGEKLVNKAFGSDEPELDATQIALTAVAEIDAIIDGSDHARAGVKLHEAVSDALQAINDASERKGPVGIPTGFRSIDRRLGGLETGTLTVIAGRPGMGKSAFGQQVAISAARHGVSVLLFSLEMSARELGRRALAVSGVPVNAMKTGHIDCGQAERIVLAQRALGDLPLMIVDAPGLTAAAIASRARSVSRKGLGLIVIDHLHIIRPEDADIRSGPTFAVGQISRAIKRLAKDLRVPVVLLAQLNRGVEGREDKRPGLGDLRQTGDIEQDADAVGFVYRPEYYHRSPEPREGESQPKFEERMRSWRFVRDQLAGRAEIIWAKVRDGETGTDFLSYDGPTTSFMEQLDV